MAFEQPIMKLIPCNFCGRSFAEESIVRHEGICIKTSRKRPIFDSSKQRDVAPTKSKLKKSRPTASRTKPKAHSATGSSWRQKHEEFINTVRAAREVTAAIKEGGKLPPPPPAAINPDYVQCPHCMRRFNSTAAERHIPFCAEQHKRLSNKKNSPAAAAGISNQAAMRASARHYRPPNLQPSAGRRISDGSDSRSAPARTTRARTIPLTQPKTGTVPNSRHTFDKTRKSKNPKWDDSIEVGAINTDVRTRTGLKPSSGITSSNDMINRNEQPPSNFMQNGNKQPVRKVAGKGTVSPAGFKPKRNSIQEQPRHDWSSDSYHSDSDGEGRGYNASDYETPTNRYSMVNGTKKPSVSFQNGSKAYRSNNTTGTYTKKPARGNGQIYGINSGVKEGDFYDWMKSAQIPTHNPISTTSAQKTDNQASKFCHECGSRYPITNAKFCCECGVRRIRLS